MPFPGAIPPPDGLVPNFDDPMDALRTCNYVTQALTIVLVTAFVAVRYYAKSRVPGGDFGWDDYATYTSYFLLIGYCTTACFGMSPNHGPEGLPTHHYRHQWDTMAEVLISGKCLNRTYNVFSRYLSISSYSIIFSNTRLLQSGYVATIFYAPKALTVKLALIYIIVRIFGSVHKKTLVGLYVFIGMMVLYYVSALFIKIFSCRPISAYWKGESGKCMDQKAVITADAIISVVSDLVILLLPTPLTWSLQLPLRKRLRVIAILCAGGIATAFSIYRLVLVLKDGNTQNQTMLFMKIVLSGNAEAGIGLICACLPSITALVVRRNKGSSYYADQSFSRQGELGRGEIMLTRSFHVDHTSTSTKQADGYAFDLNHDQEGLTSDIQGNPQSNLSGRRSESTN
ncbi:hypothetical protein FOVSG1_006547 [Fusarium oxysporum f. sp. vasinfectum]